MIKYKPASEAAVQYSFPCMTENHNGDVAIWFSESTFMWVQCSDVCVGNALITTDTSLAEHIKYGHEKLLPPGAQFIFTQE